MFGLFESHEYQKLDSSQNGPTTVSEIRAPAKKIRSATHVKFRFERRGIFTTDLIAENCLQPNRQMQDTQVGQLAADSENKSDSESIRTTDSKTSAEFEFRVFPLL